MATKMEPASAPGPTIARVRKVYSVALRAQNSEFAVSYRMLMAMEVPEDAKDDMIKLSLQNKVYESINRNKFIQVYRNNDEIADVKPVLLNTDSIQYFIIDEIKEELTEA